MAAFSFDIVSEYDKAEMNNAFLQAQKELSNRYDFKGTPAAIEWLGDKTGLKVIGNNEWQIDSIVDIFRKKLATRNLTSKILDETKIVNEANMRATKEIPFKEGLDQEKAKKITKLLKEKAPKVKAQIQGETVRVTSNSKDNLQAVISLIKEANFDFPLNFTNYR